MEVYCVKEKRHTPNVQGSEKVVITNNNRKLLRYHGTPKLTMFSKNTLLSFSDRYYSNLSFTKSFRKKDCFYAKLWTKKDLWH